MYSICVIKTYQRAVDDVSILKLVTGRGCLVYFGLGNDL